MSHPTDHLSPAARAIYDRLVDYLKNRGRWDDVLYATIVVVAADAVARYLDLARAGDPDAEIERQQGRALLVELNYLSPERARLASVNAAGLDADLAALCEPFNNDDK